MIFQRKAFCFPAEKLGGRREGQDEGDVPLQSVKVENLGLEKPWVAQTKEAIQQGSKTPGCVDPPTLLTSSCGALLWVPTANHLLSTRESIPSKSTHAVLAQSSPSTAVGMAASIRLRGSLEPEASPLDDFPLGSREDAHRSGMPTSISLRLGQSLAERRHPRHPSACPPLSPTHQPQRTLCQARLSFASISLSALHGDGHHSMPQTEAVELSEPSREGDKGSSPQLAVPVPAGRLGFRYPGERLGAAMSEAFSRLKEGSERAGSLRLRLPMFRLPFFDESDSDAAESALNHVYAGTMARTLSQVRGKEHSMESLS